jgi:electron transport complex protein RnfC
VVIEPDGEDRWSNANSRSTTGAPPDELRDFLRDAGVVGLGGAVFPSHLKLKPGKKRRQLDTLVINGAECEPFITCDDMLMRERAAGILRASRSCATCCGRSDVLIGIEDNKPEAIAACRPPSQRKRGDPASKSSWCRRATRPAAPSS